MWKNLKMAIFPWREKAIFRASEVPLDADEIKLRFRRKFLRFSILVGISILAIPLFREKMPGFRADRQIRVFAKEVLEARAIASRTRAPVVLSALANQESWTKQELPIGSSCLLKAPAKDAPSILNASLEGMFWRALFLSENDSSGLGVPVSEVCFDPHQGVILDSKPLNLGWFYVFFLPRSVSQQGAFRQVVLTKSGSEVLISKQN